MERGERRKGADYALKMPFWCSKKKIWGYELAQEKRQSKFRWIAKGMACIAQASKLELYQAEEHFRSGERILVRYTELTLKTSI